MSTTSRDKTHGKKIGGRNLLKWVKRGPKLVFLLFYQVWFISIPLDCIK